MSIKSTHHRLSIAAVLAAGVITVAACGTAKEEVRSAAPAAAAAPGVAEVYGSSRQLERQAKAADALAAEIAEANQRHLALRLAAAQAQVVGPDDASQRPLELWAEEGAAKQAPTDQLTGPR